MDSSKELEIVGGDKIDALLEHGWYRSGLSVFTTSFIQFDKVYYRTIWLRYDLRLFTTGKTWNKLKKRNQHFRVAFSEASQTEAQNYLYRKYRNAMPFEPARDIDQLLFDGLGPEYSPFQTMQVCVFDNNKLVACSYFDLGEASLAGISAFYDPEYAAHSLSIYMIYLELIYARQLGFTYYYPGYFIPHYARFDYKLRISPSSQSFLDPDSGLWIPMSEWDDLPIPFPFTQF